MSTAGDVATMLYLLNTLLLASESHVISEYTAVSMTVSTNMLACCSWWNEIIFFYPTVNIRQTITMQGVPTGPASASISYPTLISVVLGTTEPPDFEPCKVVLLIKTESVNSAELWKKCPSITILCVRPSQFIFSCHDLKMAFPPNTLPTL